MTLAAVNLTFPVTAPDGTPIDSLEVAQTYLENVTLEIKDIERQLGDRDRCDPETGDRLSGAAYWAWRKRAKSALLHRQRFATQLRQLIRQLRNDHHQTRLLLQRAYRVLNQLPLSAEQFELVEEIHRHIGQEAA